MKNEYFLFININKRYVPLLSNLVENIAYDFYDSIKKETRIVLLSVIGYSPITIHY